MRYENKITGIFIGIAFRIRKRRIFFLIIFAFFLSILLAFSFSLIDMFLPFSELFAFQSILFIVCQFIAFITGIVLFSRLLEPFPLSLAREIEKNHPEFMDSLICSVEREQSKTERKGIFDNALIEHSSAMLKKVDLKSEFLPKCFKTKTSFLFIVLSLFILFFCVERLSFISKAVNQLKTFAGIIPPGMLVEPGDCDLPFNSDLKVKVKILRGDKKAFILIKSGAETRKYELNMKTKDSGDFNFYALSKPLSYQVVTPSLKSPVFKITLFSPPEFRETKLKFMPPPYTGMDIFETNELKNYALPAETEIFVSAKPVNPQCSALIMLNNEKKSLQEDIYNKGWLFANFTLNTKTMCSLLISDNNGRQNKYPPFEIECIPDAPPTIEITEPANDIKIKAKEEIFFQAVTSDDYGVNNVTFCFSVSGSPPENVEIFRAKQAPDNSAVTRTVAEHVFETIKHKVLPGDVITCFFTATDCREPEKQSSRSQIIFIEVTEDYKSPETQGSGTSVEIEIFKLIAELKRLIRLTYEIPSINNNLKESTADELLKCLADLKLATSGLIGQIRQTVQPESKQAFPPFLSKLEGASESLDDAVRLARSTMYEKSAVSQQKALAFLTSAAQEIIKNMPKGQGAGKGDSQNQPDEQGKKVDNIMSASQIMNSLKSLKNDIDSLAVRQKSLNEEVRDNINFNSSGSEIQRLEIKQEELSKDTKSAIESIPEIFRNSRFPFEMRNANESMKKSANSLNRNNLPESIVFGREAHFSLLSAGDIVNQLMRQIASEQINAIANKAEFLSKTQSEQSGRSAEMASKNDQENKEFSETAKKRQEQIIAETNELMKMAEQVADNFRDSYPFSSNEISSAIQKSSDIQPTMKKAGNALLYRKLMRASEFQKTASEKLANFANQIKTAKKGIPKISQEELLSLIQKINNAESQLEEIKQQSQKAKPSEKAKGISSAIARSIKTAGEDIENTELTDLSNALSNIAFDDKAERDFAAAKAILGKTETILGEYLLKSEIGRRTDFRRKTSSPPEKYRNHVKEYFRALSSE